MEQLLKEERFDFLSDKDKRFLMAFDSEMNRLGTQRTEPLATATAGATT